MDHSASDKFIWIDLEMTGLDPSKDVIIEVAAIVTDSGWNELAQFSTGIKHAPNQVEELFSQNPWQMDSSRSSYRQEMLAISESGVSIDDAQAQLIKFLKDNNIQPMAVLAGNSIHADRGFIKKAWPELDGMLHYRMLDVSSFKIVMQSQRGLGYVKQEKHRALDDIRESIAELKFYLKELSQ